jgi:NAD(P)-dependent dehydrogenase (short-subunit alcohol dehydrogenase family)
MQVDLSNRVAVITGAASGIGRGMALLFAKNSATAVVNDINPEGGEKVVDEIRSAGGQARFYQADVSNQGEVQTMMDAIAAEYGKIDILVNNAGINIGMKERGPIHDFPDEAWHKILQVDLDGVYYCSKAALKYMTQANYGKIINISSIVGAVPLRNQSAFAAAKAGVIQLTKAMAIELAPYGINVNVILPGSINVPGMREGGLYQDGRYESIMSHIPMKRPGTPDDIAYGALYLASDAASYVTGSVLVIDGGWTCGFARDW